MKIFIVPFHVTRMKNTIMPEGLLGAFVKCHVIAEDYVEATDRALKSLVKDGLHPKEILEPIWEVELDAWSNYVADNFPKFMDHFPAAEEMRSPSSVGRVIYGPFASYDETSSPS